MFKKFQSLLLASLLLLSPAGQVFGEPSRASLEDPRLKAVYNWVKSVQHPSGLLSTREGKEGFCFVYDQALAVYVFLIFGDYYLAKNVLSFFQKKYKEQIKKGRFIGFVDMYFSTGASGAVYRAGGPNAWLLNAINEYTFRTGDEQFIPMATAIADWLVDLQAIDGGLMGGHHPNLFWESTEHNADAFAALRNFYYFTKDPLYAQKAEEFGNWLDEVAYIPYENRFGNGKNDVNYALDTSSWTVLAVGPRYKVVLETAEEMAQNKQYYQWTDTEVDGFDFGGPYYGTPFPDKDAVWFEGTGQMALAYMAVGDHEKGDYFVKELEKCLTPSEYYPGTLGLPYASNPGTPPYGGWQMTDSPICLSSTAWYIFAKTKYNPFNLGGQLVFDGKIFDWPPAGVEAENFTSKQFVPVIDDFEKILAKITSAYPRNDIEKENCLFNLSLEFNEVSSGSQALRLLFIPRGIAGVQGEFQNKDIYRFSKKKQEQILITTTSLQPEFYSETEEIEMDEGPAAGMKQPAQAIVRRKFMTPQNWERYNALTLFLKHDNSPNFFFIGIKDESGQLFLSKEIQLHGEGWQEHTFHFTKDFRQLDSPDSSYNKMIKVSELWIGIRSGIPFTESIVYLDDIQLQ